VDALVYDQIWPNGRFLQDSLAGPANDQTALQSDQLWYVGVLMEMFGTLAGVAGKQMFRHAAVAGDKMYYVYGGVLVIIVYPAMDIVALEFAAQTVVSTVAGMVVVWNILFAPCTLGEDMTTKRLSAAVVIMLGIVGCGSFGPHYEVVRTTDELLKQMFTTPGAIIYYLLLALFLVIGYGVLLPNEKLMPKQSLRNGALQGALSGAINGNAFVVKAAIIFVEQGKWQDFMLYFLWALTAAYHLAAIALLAYALRSHEALHVVTIYEAMSIFVGAVSGNMVLAEYQGQTPLEIALYVPSVLIIMCGMTLMVYWPNKFGEGDEILWNTDDIEAMTENVPICKCFRDRGCCCCCGVVTQSRKGENASLVDGAGAPDYDDGQGGGPKKKVTFGGAEAPATDEAAPRDAIDRVLDWGSNTQEWIKGLPASTGKASREALDNAGKASSGAFANVKKAGGNALAKLPTPGKPREEA